MSRAILLFFLFWINQMQKAIEKAGGLLEAMAYINRYSGKIVVIKLGGSVMDSLDSTRDILLDVKFMHTVGIRPVIIHGGGKAISSAMEERNMEVQFVQGRRYTDSRALTVVEHVLCNEINNGIVNILNELNCDAMGLHTLGSCVLTAQKTYLMEEDRKIDLGFVGAVTDVNAKLIRLLCKSGTIPIIAPLARDIAGQKFNCNADTSAGKIAASLEAEKFVCISDTHGIRKDIDDPESFMPVVSMQEVQDHIEDGTISSGMLPKVDACMQAIEGNVKRAHIIDGRIRHSLLLEIFSDKGVGTLITRNNNTD